MKRFIKWSVDPYRRKERERLTKNKNEDKIGDMLEDWLLEHQLGIRDREGELGVFYPLFGENISHQYREMWNIIESVITVESNGFGVKIRNSLEENLCIIDREGLCPVLLRPIIQDLEYALLGLMNSKPSKKKEM